MDRASLCIVNPWVPGLALGPRRGQACRPCPNPSCTPCRPSSAPACGTARRSPAGPSRVTPLHRPRPRGLATVRTYKRYTSRARVLTCCTRCDTSASTGCGSGESRVCPSPSFPRSPLPQVQSAPSPVMAAACSGPQSTCATLTCASAATRVGSASDGVPPVPLVSRTSVTACPSVGECRCACAE